MQIDGHEIIHASAALWIEIATTQEGHRPDGRGAQEWSRQRSQKSGHEQETCHHQHNEPAGDESASTRLTEGQYWLVDLEDGFLLVCGKLEGEEQGF
jgi:hypothetical protein